MKAVIVVTGLVLVLSGCANAASPTLEQKLAGRSEAERLQALRAECVKEAGWKKIGVHTGHNGSGHIRRMTEICNALADEAVR